MEEQNHQEAVKLSRELNGNKRRRSAVPPRVMETRASKKTRMKSLPAALSPETPTQSSFNDPSLSLISPPITDSSPEIASPFGHSMQVESPIKPATSAPSEIFSSSFTFSSPLSISSFTVSSVQKDPFLSEDNSFIENHVGQNLDSTWFIGSQAAKSTQASGSENTVRATRPARKAAPKVSTEHHTKAIDAETLSPQQQKRRGTKRKSDDDDLWFQEKQSSPDLTEEIPDESEKKQTRKRKAYTRTAPNAAKKPKLPLYHENVQNGKPEPIGHPEVWSFIRQQLCETLPYYQAYQSGAYTHNGIAHGIVIDKEVSIRDKFDEEIVITSVGGGRVPDAATGKMVYKKDQIFTPIANGFMRAMELKSPVVVIAGQGNKISPSKLPHYYNVLDWFHVTDVWQEKVLGHNEIRVSIWKVRLEKIDRSKRSWWAAKTAMPHDNQTRPTASKHTCAVCKHESKVRFNIGPACLNVSCSEFFNFGTEYDDSNLDYHPAFLEERTEYLGTPPGPLSPPPPIDEELNQEDAYGYEIMHRRGIVCQKCGCCTRRIEWRQWSCENEDCDYTYRVRQLTVPVSKVIAKTKDDALEMDTESRLKEDTPKAPHKSLPFHQSIVGSYDLYNFDLPNEFGGISGSIRHFKSNRLINQQKDGPNDLFLEIQASELNLRRGVAVHKGTTQEILTAHFTQNFGAPYKYLVAQDSKGFGDAPPSVIKAAKRMAWAGQHALMKSQESYHPFNECLVLGYFDGSRIGFHDDGEKTLGPTIATLSLGAKATMNFRPKKKAHIPSLEEGTVRNRGRGKGLTNSTEGKDKKPVVLSIQLEHGDIVIMHGREIQRLFEHEVVPNGGLRFALTCRHIDPNTLLNDDERRIAAEKGTFPTGSEKYDYDGSIHATAVIPQHNRGLTLSNELKAKFEVGELDQSDLEIVMKGLSEIVSTKAKST